MLAKYSYPFFSTKSSTAISLPYFSDRGIPPKIIEKIKEDVYELE
jgi:hypothetical protein